MVAQRFETDVTFQCPECKQLTSTSVEVPEPDWSAMERSSDMMSEGSTEVVCPRCSSEFQAYVFNSGGHCEVTLDEFPDTHVNADMAFFSRPDEDDWASYAVPDDPTGIFLDTYHHTADLLKEHGGNGAHLLNRMIFAQLVSALEAYLADTLINAVMEENEILLRLLASDSDLTREKFTLVQIISDPEFVKTKVRNYLKSLVYHNIPRVRSLYNAAFKVDLFKILGDDGREKLLQAIEYRHHCVHRNGIDGDGNRLEVFTKEYVQGTADLLKGLVEAIEDERMPAISSPNGTFLGDVVF
ncbi:hypothetical protein ACTZWT_11505 [Rhodopseudomonas sp. NSM]|uniref:hypothetical protein n=1 Tax=Rhodopseudomonas sp. NSM TaxID=3457630 RepID=UPI004036059F